MSRIAILIYGIVSYLIFFGTFLYSIGFIGDLFVPKTIDSEPTSAVGVAVAINMALLSLFAVQHSGMARPAFKRWWTKIVPRPAERATYTLLSSLVLIATYALWQPIGGTVWHVESEAGRGVLTALYFGGWATVLYATALIDHFDLFGLRQVWLNFRGEEYTHKPFGTPGAYKWIRHPLYIGWLTVFWAAPTMSIGHLLFTVVCTGYILLAVIVEEKDLVEHFGETYRRYQKTTPMFFPRFGRRAPIVIRVGEPAPVRASSTR